MYRKKEFFRKKIILKKKKINDTVVSNFPFLICYLIIIFSDMTKIMMDDMS